MSNSSENLTETILSPGQILLSEGLFEKLKQDSKIKNLLIELNKQHNAVAIEIENGNTEKK